VGPNCRPPDPDARIGVFLICGPQLFACALAAFLSGDREIAVVGTERHVDAAAERLKHADIGVVVLSGIRSPRDATLMISSVHEARADLRVLVLGSSHNEQTQLACVQAGAVGYINDDVEGAQFLQAIKRVHAGEVLFTQSVLSDLLNRSRRRPRGTSPPHEAPALAPREIEVLQSLVSGKSTEEVASELSITVSTVRTHLKNVLEKLGSHSKLEAVITAIRSGIIELPSNDR
jgi:DNA-binding NarL/FixJ family response regulator